MDQIKVSKEIMAEGMVDASELNLEPGVWPRHRKNCTILRST